MATGSSYSYTFPSGSSVTFAINQKLLIYDNFYFGYNSSSAFGKSYLVNPNKNGAIYVNSSKVSGSTANTFYYRGYFPSSGTHVVTPFYNNSSKEQWHISDASFYNVVIKPMVPTNIVSINHVETINSCFISYAVDDAAAEIRYRVNSGNWKYITRNHNQGQTYDLTVEDLTPDTDYIIELGLRKDKYQVWGSTSISIRTLIDQLKLPIMYNGFIKNARVWYRDSDSGVKRVISFKYRKPVITKQPLSVLANVGDSASFSLEADDSVSYQWQKSDDKITWSNISGATSNIVNFTVNNSDYDRWFRCVVNTSDGAVVNSNEVKVIDGDTSYTLSIIREPEDAAVAVNRRPDIYVVADGSNVTYQWYYKKSTNTNFYLWTGQTKNEITVNANETWDGMQAYCIVKDDKGNTVQTRTVTISLISSYAFDDDYY